MVSDYFFILIFSVYYSRNTNFNKTRVTGMTYVESLGFQGCGVKLLVTRSRTNIRSRGPRVSCCVVSSCSEFPNSCKRNQSRMNTQNKYGQQIDRSI